jgi:hypothetical protein
VNNINNSVTSPNNNINNTNNKSSRVIDPFSRAYRYQTITIPSTGSQSALGRGYLFNYSLRTYPAAGNPLTILPSLTATTCTNATNNMVYDGSILWERETYYFKFAPLGNQDFEIYSKLYSSGQFIGNDLLIYRRQGGNVTFINQAYFV